MDDIIALFTFGKYRNRPIKEIVQVDPSYIVWAYGAVQSSGITKKQARKAQKLMAQSVTRVSRAVGYGPRYDKDLDGPEEYKAGKYPRAVYYSDGSGYLPASGPCGPLYFDCNGNT